MDLFISFISDSLHSNDIALVTVLPSVDSHPEWWWLFLQCGSPIPTASIARTHTFKYFYHRSQHIIYRLISENAITRRLHSALCVFFFFFFLSMRSCIGVHVFVQRKRQIWGGASAFSFVAFVCCSAFWTSTIVCAAYHTQSILWWCIQSEFDQRSCVA